MRQQATLTALIALCYGERYLMPLLVVSLWQAWNLDFLTVGLLLSAMPLGYHVGLFFSRYLASASLWGSIGLCLGAVGSLASAWASSSSSLMLARIITGLACGLILAKLPAGLRKVETGQRRHPWVIAMMTGIPLGVGSAMFFGGVVASLATPFFVFLLLTVTYGSAFVVKGDVFHDTNESLPSPASSQTDQMQKKSPHGALYQVTGACLYSMAFGLILSWFPLWAVDQLEWTQSWLGFLLASLTLIVIPAGVYVGRRAGQIFCNLDWRSEGYGLFAGLGILLATPPLFLLLAGKDFGVMFISLALFLFIMVALLPPVLRMVQAIRFGIKSSTILSLAVVTAFLIGEVIPGVVGGWLADLTDLFWVINLAPLLTIASGVLLLLGSYQAYVHSPAAKDAFPMSPFAVAASQTAQWVFRQVSKIFHSEIVVLRSDEHSPHGEVVKDPQLDPEAPTLLIANHPNALLDAVVIYVTARQPLRSVAKATLWQNPGLRPLMKLAGAVPIIRHQDKELLEKSMPSVMKSHASNDDAMRFVAEALCRHSFVIYPEGRSHDEPAMAAFKTGGARMLLRAAQLVHETGHEPHSEDSETYYGDVNTSLFLAPKIKTLGDLGFQPVGLYFQRKSSFRSGVVVHYGRRITIGEVLSQEELARIPEEGMAPDLVHKLTAAMDQSLRDLLPEATDEASLEHVRSLASLLSTPHQKKSIRERYRNELILKNMVALASKRTDQEHESFLNNLSAYEEARKQAKLPDWMIRDLDDNQKTYRRSVRKSLFFGALFLPWISLPAFVGWLLYGWVYRVVKFVSEKFAPDETELATHKLLIGMVLSGVVSALYAVIATAYVLGAGWYDLVILAPISPFLCGLLALKFNDAMRIYGPQWRWISEGKTRSAAEALMSRRHDLMLEFERWARDSESHVTE